MYEMPNDWMFKSLIDPSQMRFQKYIFDRFEFNLMLHKDKECFVAETDSLLKLYEDLHIQAKAYNKDPEKKMLAYIRLNQLKEFLDRDLNIRNNRQFELTGKEDIKTSSVLNKADFNSATESSSSSSSSTSSLLMASSNVSTTDGTATNLVYFQTRRIPN